MYHTWSEETLLNLPDVWNWISWKINSVPAENRPNEPSQTYKNRGLRDGCVREGQRAGERNGGTEGKLRRERVTRVVSG